MGIVDRHGLRPAVSTHAANHPGVTLVQLSFDFYMIVAKPENLIGDRAYDSDQLDTESKKEGIEMISPHRKGRKKPPTQDRRRLRRYERRWLVERFFCVDPMATSSARSLGVLRREFSRLRAASFYQYLAQANLR